MRKLPKTICHFGPCNRHQIRIIILYINIIMLTQNSCNESSDNYLIHIGWYRCLVYQKNKICLDNFQKSALLYILFLLCILFRAKNTQPMTLKSIIWSHDKCKIWNCYCHSKNIAECVCIWRLVAIFDTKWNRTEAKETITTKQDE